MKKCLLLLLYVISFSSCTDDVKFNNPAFQTVKDNVFWRALNYKASINAAGEITIEGESGYEKVILHTASTTQQTYILGLNDVSTASYSNTSKGQLADFYTGTNKGNGQIVITDYDIEAKTISGTFKFTAVNADEENVENPTINFTEGVFYKVPVSYASGGLE